MTTARIGLRVLAGLAMPAVTMAAPSWSVTINGSATNHLDLPTNLEAGQTFTIEAHLHSDGLLVGGWDHGLKLISSPLGNHGNDAWSYGRPSAVIVGNHPSAQFTDNLGNVHAPGEFTLGASAIQYRPGANSVFPGSPTSAFGVLDFSAYYGPFEGTHVETFNITVLWNVPNGPYVFELSDGGQGYYLSTQPTGPGDNGQRAFGSSSIFTITPTPEPASALLLLAALPFLRRRQVS